MKRSNSKQSKNIYTNSLFKSNYESKRNVATSPQTCDKSSFYAFSNEEKLIKNYPNLEDTCTQTSKTIIQLAQLEKSQKSQMFPDSLNPKEYFESSKSLYTLDGSVEEIDCDPLSYARKSNIVQYLEACTVHKNTEQPAPGKSLTQTFLEKTNRRNYNSNVYKDSICSDPSSSINNRSSYLQQTSPLRKLMESNVKFKSQSYVEPQKICCTENNCAPESNLQRFKVKNVREKIVPEKPKQTTKYFWLDDSQNTSEDSVNFQRNRRSNSFMSPTISSENKNKGCGNYFNRLIPPTRRGRSISPQKCPVTVVDVPKKVPYIDGSEINSTVSAKRDTDGSVVNSVDTCYSKATFKKEPELIKAPQLELNDLKDLKSLGEDTASITLPPEETSTTSDDYALYQSINRLRDKDWNKSLRGLVEIVEICRLAPSNTVYPHMTCINQRLIELLKSPRSHVSRTACQAAGHLFEYIKDTRRPEFDEIVDTLLAKTADSNKFIRHDANLALDCMVTHIAAVHAIRALTMRGPQHKNSLVRTATARLIICAVVIAGTDTILHPSSGEHTRKRIILNMTKFLEDKCLETRKFGQRLYKQLQRHPMFENFLKRYLEREIITKIKKCTKSGGMKK